MIASHIQNITINKEIVLENGQLRVSILPECGGKISSIKSNKSGTEFLLQPSQTISNERDLQYGMSFLPPYAFGFDDCFPNIAKTTLRLPIGERDYPDHGELWTSKFNYEINGREKSCKIETNGVFQEYIFKKKVSLNGKRLLIEYELENTSDTELNYIWSAHPLLEVDPEDEILLPEGIRHFEVYYSNIQSLLKGDHLQWPINVRNVALANVQEPWKEIALKLFANNISSGKAGFYRKKSDESIVFNFDTYHLRHLGLWLCYGGWPESSEEKQLTVAIEPTNCDTDCLSEAIQQGKHTSLMPGKSNSWFFELCIEPGYGNV
ncbi:MAG: hypothetical protein ED557_10935 [Balneola sp.]|nr:MAG: hypothetical protein ED557_10935 [Balneola sp.]